MLGSRGQQYTVFQLLQGAILAAVMLTIVWAVVSSVHGQIPTSDVYSVSCELLGSAFSAAGTGTYFTREALLVEQDFGADALAQCAGLPSAGVTVGLVCERPYCFYDGEPLDEGGECSSYTRWCDGMGFVSGDRIDVCTICPEWDKCFVVFGADEC
ncbi:MAG: hypothetical protein JW834_03885 [Candidatus Diapherotrites archaeon]|nr:hypothetical protein [Candidatus Diapherotrites archaeon]